MSARVLIAGIGNIFLGDDGFGVEVVEGFARRQLPEGVRAVAFGIRGLDLVHALLDGCDAAILVDAAPRGGAPGTLYVLEPEIDSALESLALDAHDLNPARALAAAKSMGAKVERIRVVGVEPAEADEFASGLSAPVAAAVEPAREMIARLVNEFLRGAHA